MSISTTYFVNTTVAADNAAEVYAWLQKNATEYFDSFAISEDSTTVSCFIGALEAVTFGPFGAAGFAATVALPNGETKTAKINSASAIQYMRKAVKTSNGIAFQIDSALTNPFFFVTKAANGETAIVFSSTEYMSTNTVKQYAVIPTKDNAFSAFQVYYDISANDYTSLAPIVCPGGTGYLPHIFRAVFNQYRGTEGVITLCGKQYYTNGYLMLAL